MLLKWEHSIPRNLFMSNKNQMHQHNQGSHHDQLNQDHVYEQIRFGVFLLFLKFPYNLTRVRSRQGWQKKVTHLCLSLESKRRGNKGKKWLEIHLCSSSRSQKTKTHPPYLQKGAQLVPSREVRDLFLH